MGWEGSRRQIPAPRYTNRIRRVSGGKAAKDVEARSIVNRACVNAAGVGGKWLFLSGEICPSSVVVNDRGGALVGDGGVWMGQKSAEVVVPAGISVIGWEGPNVGN